MQAFSYQTYSFIVSCESIVDFLSNSFFIVQIHHAKSSKMKVSVSQAQFIYEISPLIYISFPIPIFYLKKYHWKSTYFLFPFP